MFTVLDGILAILILVGLFLGYCRGFFASIPRFVVKILAVCLTFMIASPIVDNFIGPYFADLFKGNIESYIIEHCPDINADNANQVLPFVYVLIAKLFNITFSAGAETDAEAFVPELAAKIADPLGHTVAVALSYLLVFIAIYIILKIALALLSACCSKGILKVLNKFLGMMLGFSLAFLGCCVVTLLVSAMFPSFGEGILYDFFISVNPLFMIFNIN
jgi:uncharacterized membrane protein required for colicin V production